MEESQKFQYIHWSVSSHYHQSFTFSFKSGHEVGKHPVTAHSSYIAILIEL